MKIIKNIEEKLKTLTETEISSQVIIKGGQKLLKKYNHSIIKGSTTISQESTSKPMEMGDILNKDEDIV